MLGHQRLEFLCYVSHQHLKWSPFSRNPAEGSHLCLQRSSATPRLIYGEITISAVARIHSNTSVEMSWAWVLLASSHLALLDCSSDVTTGTFYIVYVYLCILYCLYEAAGSMSYKNGNSKKSDENNVISGPSSGNNCIAFALSGQQIMSKWIYRCLVKYVITFKRLDVIVGSQYV